MTLNRDHCSARRCARSSPSPPPRRARRRQRSPGSSSSASTCRRRASGTDGRRGRRIKNPSGFEHALSLAIAKQLKIPEVEFLRAPFGTLFSPAPKKYDFAFEEVTITAQRKKVVAFSTPYFDANQGVLVAKGRRSRRASRSSSPCRRARRRTRPGSRGSSSKLRPAKQPLVYSASSTRRVRRRRDRALRCADPRRADRRLAEQEEAGRVRRSRRPDRHERVLRRGPGEGQQVQALPRHGDRDAACQRDDHPATEEVAAVHTVHDPEIAL